MKEPVRLVAMSGTREVYGGNGLVMGALDDDRTRARSMERLERWQGGELPFLARKKMAGKKKKNAKQPRK